MTDEEKLCAISDVFREHNRIFPDMTHSQAVEKIRRIVNDDDSTESAVWIANVVKMTFTCSKCKGSSLYNFLTCPYCKSLMVNGEGEKK